MLRDYPDPLYTSIRESLAVLHQIPPDFFMVGNGAAELFTWVAMDAADLGVSLIPQPGFADYERALKCWSASSAPYQIPLESDERGPHRFPLSASSQITQQAQCLWVTNPHNPTGQLWERKDLLAMLDQFKLVVVDEAFLPLTPGGESHSLLSFVEGHPNLVVIRSLTKLYGLAGLRFGYVAANPDRLLRWSSSRDPWPVNSLAVSLVERLLQDPDGYRSHCIAVQRWVAREGAWLHEQLGCLPWVQPLPSDSNFLLIRGRQGLSTERSLSPLRLALEREHRVLVRDCQSFHGLGDSWLRLGLQERGGNRRLVAAMKSVLSDLVPGRPEFA